MSEMLEKILSDENIRLAKKRVYANKGAGGVDGVTVQELDEYLEKNWKSIKQQIRESTNRSCQVRISPAWRRFLLIYFINSATILI
ncbi:MAG: hypothetical protein IJ192_02865 [Clostridia bacterium]|nr:hypothetical protein [Clostridia bacterium]MBR2175677.1 hypothetical protein [Clostridia bacterium]